MSKKLKARLETLEQWAIFAADVLGIEPPPGLKPPVEDSKPPPPPAQEWVPKSEPPEFVDRTKPWNNPALARQCDVVATGGKFR